MWVADAARIPVAVAVVQAEATAPIRPLAWEPPYAVRVALKRQKDKQNKTNHTAVHLRVKVVKEGKS